MDDTNNYREDASLWVAETQQADFRANRATQKRFHAWLAESESHAAAFASALRTFHRLGARAAYSDINLGGLVQKHRRSQVRARRRARVKPWLAAAAALTVGPCLPLLPQLNAAPTFYATRVGEQRTATLDDGSQITLNSGTRVLVQRIGRYREIDVIRGETFFSMAQNPQRPTRVFTSLGMVAGRASAFDVLQLEHEFRVIAVHGELSVSTVNPGNEALTPGIVDPGSHARLQPVALHTGDVALFRANLRTVDIRLQTHAPLEIDRLLAWRHGILAFINEPAQAIVESFNLYNRQQLAIADSSIAALSVSGSFHLDDPQSFILALQRVYPASKIITERDPVSGALQLRRRTRGNW